MSKFILQGMGDFLHFLLYGRDNRLKKVLVKYCFFAGNTTFPGNFYTYKPYDGYHRRPHRRDGTSPSQPSRLSSPPFDHSPISYSSLTAPQSSPLSGRAHSTFIRPLSPRSDAFPVLPGHIRAPGSPNHNTLTHSTGFTKSLLLAARPSCRALPPTRKQYPSKFWL
jgi:hypothetical protein